jgi:phasin family protein
VFAIGRTAFGALAESQTAVARGVEAMALEAAALARSGFSAAADAATALLGARNLADAFEVQAGFARRSIDAALDGSVRLSEIAVKTTAEASRPILARLDQTWRAG